jgi:L-ascorbate metabolism protein UlaG (beta-lactamase superfamily)
MTFRSGAIAVALGTLAIASAVGLVLTRGSSNAQQQIATEGAGAPPPAQWTVEVTYIANEGVLVAAGDKQVLIDGLFREYRTYPVLPQPYRDRLETAAAPYDGIDVILTSHIHGDHFHPAAVARYLQSNPAARFQSSEQAIAELKKEMRDDSSIASRVTSMTPALMERMTDTVAGIQIEFLGLGHGTGRNRDLQNLGHLFSLGGKKFLHVGDADTSVEIFDKFNLEQENIDVAFLPAWFLTEAPDLIRSHIRPKHIVVIHNGATTGERVDAAMRSFPSAVAFTRMLEKKYY